MSTMVIGIYNARDETRARRETDDTPNVGVDRVYLHASLYIYLMNVCTLFTMHK